MIIHSNILVNVCNLHLIRSNQYKFRTLIHISDYFLIKVIITVIAIIII